MSWTWPCAVCGGKWMIRSRRSSFRPSGGWAMSSKRAERRTERSTAAPPPRGWSITGRLTGLYTVSAGGRLILSSVFLYWVLASNLAREDHEFLADKIHVVRSILRDHPQERDALEEEDGTLLETPGMADRLPAVVFPTPTGARESLGDGMHWRSPDGRSYHLLAAWAK